MKRKHIILIVALAVALAAVIGLIIWSNNAIEITEYKIENAEIPQGFSGFRIAQISDLHNTEFGKDNAKLLAALEQTNPDIIVLTGDIIDSRRTDISIVANLAPKLTAIAPTYFVTGNHEGRLDTAQYKEFTDALKNSGVVVLQNEVVTVIRGDESITLVGVEDPRRDIEWENDEGRFERMEQKLKALSDEYKNSYSILLSHRPDMLDVYAEADVDLVLSGHMHGGQFRIPFIGGLYAPSHGFFPEYDAGYYSKGSTEMIISRGLGNSLFPFRINNRPEIVVIELETK